MEPSSLICISVTLWVELIPPNLLSIAVSSFYFYEYVFDEQAADANKMLVAIPLSIQII